MIHEKLKNKKLILASASPRRQMLLKGLGVKFDVIAYDLEEVCPGKLTPEETVVCLASRKSSCYQFAPGEDQTIVIAADTIVVLKDEIINKPEDEKDACRLLAKLSGSMHLVYTGVSLRSSDKEVTFFDTTKVWFRNLTDDEIHYYIQQYKPLDKAGAYGVQEWIGYVGVEKMEGSFYNVMGFPTFRVYEEFIRF